MPSLLTVLAEQGAGENVAEQEDDADDLVRFDASGDDAFRQVAGVGLQRLDAAGLEHLDVVVVHRRGLGEDFFLAHRGEQFGVRDAAGPFLSQLSPVLPQMCNQLAQ